MYELILFGGTTEGRLLSSVLSQKKIKSLVCVASDYGESLVDISYYIDVRAGKLDLSAMKRLFIQEAPKLVIDATHPYAYEASRNIKKACQLTSVNYMRVSRSSLDAESSDIYRSMPQLIEKLNNTGGVIFSSLGANEANELTKIIDFQNRVILRILPITDALNHCLELGYPPKNIICMQGPFSRELNAAMFRETGSKILLTKESGTYGGFKEKLLAAHDCSMDIFVLARPEKDPGLTIEDAINAIGDFIR